LGGTCEWRTWGEMEVHVQELFVRDQTWVRERTEEGAGRGKCWNAEWGELVWGDSMPINHGIFTSLELPASPSKKRGKFRRKE